MTAASRGTAGGTNDGGDDASAWRHLHVVADGEVAPTSPDTEHSGTWKSGRIGRSGPVLLGVLVVIAALGVALMTLRSPNDGKAEESTAKGRESSTGNDRAGNGTPQVSGIHETPVTEPATADMTSAPREVTVPQGSDATSPTGPPIPPVDDPTSPPTTDLTSDPTTEAPERIRSGAVHGCNTYGEHCDGNPIYTAVPPPDYDYTNYPHVGTVANGTALDAKCWARGGTTTNYASDATPPDPGPDPYASDLYYQVRFNGQWRWIADTYFVRDKSGYGLPTC